MLVEDVGPVSGALAAPDPTPAWQPLSFLNGWSLGYDAGRAPMYRKVGDMVQFRGLAKKGTAVAQMPVGFPYPVLVSVLPLFGGRGQPPPRCGRDVGRGRLSISGNFSLPDYVFLDTIQYSVTV